VKTIFSFFFLPLFFQLFIFFNCQTQDKIEMKEEKKKESNRQKSAKSREKDKLK
jgi:hypothetical protein